jgi:hypothetical protein
MNLQTLSCIQKLYKSDIRSMINFMQSNQEIIKLDNHSSLNSTIYIIDNNVWEQLTHYFKNKAQIDTIFKYTYEISIKYNIDKKNIIKDYLNYLIRYHPEIISKDFLNFVENIMHIEENNNKIYIQYSLTKLMSFF